MEGPLLIAANHPNSFLDAIIVTTLFKNPVFSLARGDVFANKFYTWILGLLNMLPVYRVSEGVENLENNYTTFDACQEIFTKKGIVLIFSEGRCINEWQLRPLKKGTARLAITAWQNKVPLQILPLGINYSSFGFFGKNVMLNFGEMITQKDIAADETDGRSIVAFNAVLEARLKTQVIEVAPSENEKIRKIFFVPQPMIKKIILFVPSVLGWLLHAPIYYPVVAFIHNKANDHYDSIVVALLFIIYPFYILFIAWIVFAITLNPWSWLLLAILPFTAWSLLQLKRQIK